MSANINANVLRNFIVKTLGGDKLMNHQVQKYGVDANTYAEANVDENAYLDIDEILDNKDLYAQFATLFVEEQDKDNAAVDEERQKEEALKVQDKGESKA